MKNNEKSIHFQYTAGLQSSLMFKQPVILPCVQHLFLNKYCNFRFRNFVYLIKMNGASFYSVIIKVTS